MAAGPDLDLDLDLTGLERALRAEVDGEVRFGAGSRAAYSTDASNYRQVPLGVVVPRTVEAGARAVAVCARFAAPLLSRGGGTSLGGQCTNTAVVLDWTKYCNRLVSVDPAARTCVVEPGIVLDELNRQLAPHGLKFGPQPATHNHCSLGGMIGNNSCGASAQAYGKTADNVRGLEVLTYDGLRFRAGPTGADAYERIVAGGGPLGHLYQGLRELAARHLAEIRRGFPKIPRRVSGYNLDALLPENGFDLARALVGSEGTLVTVLRAELGLVEVPKAESLLVLGFDDIYAAADAVPRLLEHGAADPTGGHRRAHGAADARGEGPSRLPGPASRGRQLAAGPVQRRQQGGGRPPGVRTAARAGPRGGRPVGGVLRRSAP